MPKKRRANGRNKPANARGHVSHIATPYSGKQGREGDAGKKDTAENTA